MRHICLYNAQCTDPRSHILDEESRWWCIPIDTSILLLLLLMFNVYLSIWYAHSPLCCPWNAYLPFSSVNQHLILMKYFLMSDFLFPFLYTKFVCSRRSWTFRSQRSGTIGPKSLDSVDQFHWEPSSKNIIIIFFLLWKYEMKIYQNMLKTKQRRNSLRIGHASVLFFLYFQLLMLIVVQFSLFIFTRAHLYWTVNTFLSFF